MLTGPHVAEHQEDVDWKKGAGKQDRGIVRVADRDHAKGSFGRHASGSRHGDARGPFAKW